MVDVVFIDQIGVDDHFFSIGLDDVIAAEIFYRLNFAGIDPFFGQAVFLDELIGQHHVRPVLKVKIIDDVDDPNAAEPAQITVSGAHRQKANNQKCDAQNQGAAQMRLIV